MIAVWAALLAACVSAAPAEPSRSAATASGAAAGQPAETASLALFDAHVHYSATAYADFTPDEALAILRRAGVRRALVSSTPDEGTFRLHDRAPEVVVPMLRPYRTPEDIGTWTRDKSVLAYVEARLRRGIHRGIGEFHLAADQVANATARGVIALSVREGIYLQVHGDARTVEEIFRLEPRAEVLWAHAGMSATADTVGRLLDRFPNLWVELALRSDVAPGGQLEASWRSLFVRHPDRFMVGTDTWVSDRWERMPEILDEVRVWLRQLPPEIAERLASANGERLFATR